LPAGEGPGSEILKWAPKTLLFVIALKQSTCASLPEGAWLKGPHSVYKELLQPEFNGNEAALSIEQMFLQGQ